MERRAGDELQRLRPGDERLPKECTHWRCPALCGTLPVKGEFSYVVCESKGDVLHKHVMAPLHCCLSSN